TANWKRPRRHPSRKASIWTPRRRCAVPTAAASARNVSAACVRSIKAHARSCVYKRYRCTMLILLLLLISLALLIRTVLIAIGLLKGPVLQTFEKYGDDETIYHPMPAMLLWTGMLLITVSPAIAAALDAAVLPLALPGI